MRALRPFVLGVSVVLVAALATGCTGAMPLAQHLGFRPDEPAPKKVIEVMTTSTACVEYAEYVEYSQQLQESYHSRASQNRAWIYVAGVLGLGAIAASGGLAAAGAAALGTIALINISGGFSAGAFATIDNSTLAEIYTISANAIDVARTEAMQKVPPAPYSDQAKCKEALDLLRSKVSSARADLEEARTNSAKAAVMRAAAQQEGLKKQIEALGLAFDVSEPTRALAPGEALLLTVSGGKPDYGARTTETALEIVKEPTKANKHVAEIKAKADAKDGTYEVVFFDSGGRTKTRKITVAKSGTPPPPAKELTVTVVPDQSTTIAKGKDRKVAFYVSGGKGAYTVGPLDANSQGGVITLEPASGQKVPPGSPFVTVTLTDTAQAGRTYGATVKDEADQSRPFTVTVAPGVRFVGVPADRKITLTQRETVSVGVQGGVQASGYAVSAPGAPATFVAPPRTPLDFVINSTDAAPGLYTVTASDDLGQAAPSLSVTVKALEVTKELVRRVQQALKDKRCDPKGIDGVLGPNTETALKCFQKAAKLTESGKIDVPTLKALGIS
jgi:hypothetical protein